MSALTPSIATALDAMRDLSAALLPSSVNRSNTHLHTLLQNAQNALQRIENAGVASPGAVSIDLLDHISHHRSVMDSTNPRLYVQQLVGSVLHGAGLERTRRGALEIVGNTLRVGEIKESGGGGGGSATTAMSVDDNSMNEDTTEASHRGLATVYNELFDVRSGAPIALVQVDESTQAQFLPSATLSALSAVPIESHLRLFDVLQKPLIGLPWTPLSQNDLNTFFSPFPLQTTVTTATSATTATASLLAPSLPTPPPSSLTMVTAAAPPIPAWIQALNSEEERFAELERIMPGDFVRDVRALGDETFHAVGLARLLDRFTLLRWPTCAVGTPFIFSITRENAASVGIPTYCDVIPEPMDLTRMRARLETVGGYAAGAAGIDALLSDAAKMVRNAKIFHGPKEAKRAEPTFPEPVSKFTASKGSIYGMAFDLERLIMKSRGHAHAALAAMQRAELRKSYRDADLTPFNDDAFWVRIGEAAQVQAVQGGYSDLII